MLCRRLNPGFIYLKKLDGILALYKLDDAVCTRGVSEMYINIGIDVSKDKLDLCWLRNISSGKKKTRVFKNKRKSFDNIVQWLLTNTKVKAEEILIVLEPTGVYHEALIYFLHQQGFNIYLANPGKAKKYSEAIGLTHKTDKSDGMMLARYGSSLLSGFRMWQPEAEEIRELKALSRRLSALEKDLQRERNRYEAAEISGSSNRVLQSLEKMMAALEQETKNLTQEIDTHIDKHPQLKRNSELLKSIKGIGDVMARELVYLFASKKFKSAKQVAAFIGLIPKLRESGKLKGRTTLSKTGPARLRAKLYMAAVVASQYNLDIMQQKDRLLNAGKTKMEALGAAMRKLVQICFGVIKNQTEYQSQVKKIMT